jgi:hypothetical protein
VVVAIIFGACMNMLLTDIYLCIFSADYGRSQGEKVIDFSSFGDGFRSCTFLLSIFDIVHASVGIVIVLNSRRIILAKLTPPLYLE